MMKKLALALAATSLVLTAAPAWAGNVSASMISPGNGQSVSGTTTVKGQAQSPDGLKSVTLVVAGVEVAGYDPSGNTAEVSYIWDTKYLPKSGSLSSNGDYSAYVRAISDAGEESIDEIIILVDNAPTVPRGVSTSVSGSTVTVSWQANPEPDIQGYRVERSSGGGFGLVSTVQGTSMQDNPGGGNYTYRVSAVRSSPTSGSRTSVPSSTARAFVNGPPSSTADGGTGGGCCSSSGGTTFPSSGSNVAGISGRGKGGLKNSGDPKNPWADGLPDFGLSLPGISGLMGIPQLPVANTLEWGEYEAELPYDYSQTGGQVPGEVPNVAFRSPDRIIPPDGLRWLAAGLLLLVGASMTRSAGSAHRGQARHGKRTSTTTGGRRRRSRHAPAQLPAFALLDPLPPPSVRRAPVSGS
jgi:hypothetical protein